MLQEGWKWLCYVIETVDQWEIWILYVLALIYGAFWSFNNVIREYVKISVVGILLFLNPIVVWVIMNYFFSITRYYRFFWIIPIYFVIAMVAAEVSVKKGKIAMCLLTIIICMAGGLIYIEQYQIAENAYKLPQEAVEICDFFVKTEEYQEGDLKISVDPELSSYIRQIDGNIKLQYGREAGQYSDSQKGEMVYFQLDRDDIENISTIYLTDALRVDECQYVVIKANKVDRVEMEQGGYKYDCTIAGYEVYRFFEQSGFVLGAESSL